jgi:hypothetical protein
MNDVVPAEEGQIEDDPVARLPRIDFSRPHIPFDNEVTVLRAKINIR